MLGWLIERTKMAYIAGKWADATSLNPGDKGQTAVMASALMKATGMRAEDAWLSCLTKWMTDHPNPDASKRIARAMILFLDTYEHNVGLGPEIKWVARSLAEAVLEGYSTAVQTSHHIGQEQGNTENKPAAPLPPPVVASPRAPPLFVTYLPQDIGVFPDGMTSNDYVFKRAMIILLKYLRENGYNLEWVGKSRGETPSVIAYKAGVSFFILLCATMHPKSPNAAPFMIQRCAARAEKENGYVRIARITFFKSDTSTKSEQDDIDISGDDLEFTFPGLEMV